MIDQLTCKMSVIPAKAEIQRTNQHRADALDPRIREDDGFYCYKNSSCLRS